MAQHASGSTAEPDQPITSGERIVTLDFIRGVAVLGILLANITAFAQPLNAYFWPPALIGGMTEGDKWVWVAQFILVDGKFRGLFTLLFGAGVMLFLERASARGSAPELQLHLQLRRLAWLLLFGLIHFFLIWRGDILTLYAVWGMVLLQMVKWRARTQLGVGVALCIAGSLLLSALLGGQYLAVASPALQADMAPDDLATVLGAASKTLAQSAQELTLYGSGSWFEIARDTITNRGHELIQELAIIGPVETLGLMLIGMALYRMGFFSGTFDSARMRKWGWIGFGGGIVLSVPVALWVLVGGFEFHRTLFVFNGMGGLLQLPMVVGLSALLVVWAPRAVQGRLGACLAAAGRMAFSNYLGTSLVMVALFQGWGLGLFGQFHRIELLGFVALAWAAMLLWSPWWLARFEYGPLEWLWRCLTYWKLLPIAKERT